MSDSNRGLYLFAAIAAFLGIGVTGAGELRCQRDYYRQSAYDVKGVGDKGPPTRFDRSGIPCLVERVATNPDATNAADKEQRDLIAQESMGLWAFWMAVFSGVTALVTAVGTYLIAAQVRLTRIAVGETSKATDTMIDSNSITQASLDIAREQFALTKSATQQQLRAYITAQITRHPIWEVGERPEVWIEARNVGQTPAYHLLHITAFDWAEYPDPPLDVEAILNDKMMAKEGNLNAVNPGDASTISILWPDKLTQEDMDTIRDGSAARAYLFGRITFTDAFGEARFLHYRFHMGGEEMLRIGTMHVAPQGNNVN